MFVSTTYRNLTTQRGSYSGSIPNSGSILANTAEIWEGFIYERESLIGDKGPGQVALKKITIQGSARKLHMRS